MTFRKLQKEYKCLQKKIEQSEKEVRKVKRYLRRHQGSPKYYDLLQRSHEVERQLRGILDRRYEVSDAIEILPKCRVPLIRSDESRELDEKLQGSLLDELCSILRIDQSEDGFETVISIVSVSPCLTIAMPEDLEAELNDLFRHENKQLGVLGEKFWITRINLTDEGKSEDDTAGREKAFFFRTQPLVKSSVFVGRENELKEFEEDFLFHSKTCFLEFHTEGDGGVGKTQLLQQMLKLCHTKYTKTIITFDDLVDFYDTESRSKAGVIKQVIYSLGVDQFPTVDEQLKKYRLSVDCSEHHFLLQDVLKALENDYVQFASEMEKEKKTIILFFDTYEVIQAVDKEKKEAKSSNFSNWLETELFPIFYSNNTKIVIAGRYPLVNIENANVTRKRLALFDPSEAENFLIRCLRVARFSAIGYQNFLKKFPAAEGLLKPFLYTLGDERVGIFLYEFPDDYQRKIDKDVWRKLREKIEVSDKKDLLEELGLDEAKLQTIFTLAGYRPIFLALFIDWFNFGKREPIELLNRVNQIEKVELQQEEFRKALVQSIEHNYRERTFVYRMAVAYRRMTPEIMYHLVSDQYTLDECRQILLEKLRFLSFTKYKECKQAGKKIQVVLLHDEVRELIRQHWNDPGNIQQKGVSIQVVDYYKEKLLSPDYFLTKESFSWLRQRGVSEEFLDKVKALNMPFLTKGDFLTALQGALEQSYLDSYSLLILAAAKVSVSQEKREVYMPELIGYAFMADGNNALSLFCEEFDTAMEDGYSFYAGLLASEAQFCRAEYAPSLNDLEIRLRQVQYYIESTNRNVEQALKIITSVNQERSSDEFWRDSVLYGKFTLWEGIAHFWLDDFDRAVEFLKKARDIFIRIESQEAPLFLANNWIGYTLYRKADFPEAGRWMQESLEGLLDWLLKELDADRATKRNIQQRIQYVYGNLAILCRYTGKFYQAIRYAEIQLNIVENLPRNKKEILRALSTLGHVLAIAGRNINARSFLEQAEIIYHDIPDRLLGGRMYSNFCQLFYGTMEFSYLIEYYRAEELHQAIELSQGTNIKIYLGYAKKAIKLLEKKPVFHKELADAYFSLGELYMMMPSSRLIGDKWALAEQAFERALYSAQKSGFKYRVIDTLERLVTLYYLQSQAGDELPPEQKKRSREKRKQYQDEIEKDWNTLQCYPNLAGRYELTLGDIHFDEALDLLEADDFVSGGEYLEKAFDHYLKSIRYKKAFNKDQYYLMLRVVYNRLNTLVDLAYPIFFPRLASLDHDNSKYTPRKRVVSREKINNWFEKSRSLWKDKAKDFKWILDQSLLRKERKVGQEELRAFADKVTRNERKGEYWKAVLVNKCLTELYWTQVNTDTVADSEKEKYQEQLVLQLNQQSRLYRLMGDFYHAKRSYERVRKIIGKIEESPLKRGLKGYTAVIKGEYLFRRGEFGKLLESIVADELKKAWQKFEHQFPGTADKAFFLFQNGEKQLTEAVDELKRQIEQLEEGPLKTLLEDRKKSFFQKRSEACFQAGELLMMKGDFFKAFSFLEKSIKICRESGNFFRLDDAIQSYLNAIYFSGGYDQPQYQEIIRQYEKELNEKIKAEDYRYPWVAAKFCITQGDVLFSRYFQTGKQAVRAESGGEKFMVGKQPERKELVDMFSKYIEACNYKARFNEASFAAGVRVLRRRIEMIPDSSSLDILSDVFRQLWQDGEELRDKKEEFEDILQLVKMRSLIIQYEEH